MASKPNLEEFDFQDILKRFAELIKPPSVRLSLIRPPKGCENDDLLTVHTYDHQPLPSPTSIRLLKLCELDKTESYSDLQKQIRCSIEIVDLKDKPEYDALSYTWGDPLTVYASADQVSPPKAWAARCMEIVCDGKPLSITTNLYTALLSLRWCASCQRKGKFKREREEASFRQASYIWIDALCIDQSNLDERSQQVSLMGRIYAQAQTVSVWLGGDDESVSDTLQNIHSLALVKDGKGTELCSLNILNKEAYECIDLPQISVKQWVELYTFFNRSWFRRAWIVQEAALAKKSVVLCGLHMFSLSLLYSALIFLQQSRWLDQIRGLTERFIESNVPQHLAENESANEQLQGIWEQFLEDVGHVKLFQSRPINPSVFKSVGEILDARAGLGIEADGQYMRTGARPERLSTILCKHRFTEATDPRDKVYAFLSIAREFVEHHPHEADLRLVPNYRKSVKDVYIDTAKFILSSWGNLRPLSLIQDASVTAIDELPSWVPDFSIEGLPGPLDYGRPIPWTASKDLDAFHLRFSLDVLQVSGVKIDTVVETAAFKCYSVNGTPIEELLKFVLKLPDMSNIRDPEMNEGLQEYLLTEDVAPWEDVRSEIPSALELSGAMRLQPRLEILWRTLLTDRFQGQHPAPADCGTAFKCSIREIMNARQEFAVSCQLKGNYSLWESSKIEIAREWSAWQTLMGTNESGTGSSFPLEFWYFQNFIGTYGSPTKELIEGHAALMKASLKDMDQNLATEVKTKIEQYYNTRKLFRTRQARLGQGPLSVVSGDEVWLLTGGFVPFLLRRVGKGRYRLIGEAYIHGIMHGEAVPSSPDSQIIDIV
jgi:hypothetical protein